MGILNSTYKYAILAIEKADVTSNLSIAATSVPFSGKFMSATPFVKDKEYQIIDDSFSDDVPNSEVVLVTAVSQNGVACEDGVGFVVTGTLTVSALVNAYTTAANVRIMTPGVEVVPTSDDFDCRFKTLSDAPKWEFDDEASRYASGDEGRTKSYSGVTTGEISFTQQMGWAGAVTSIPKYAKIMEICGHIVKPYTTTGIGFLPSNYANNITGTIWVLTNDNSSSPKTLIYRYSGCHGGNGCSIGASKVGDVYLMTMKINGKFVGTTDVQNSALDFRELTAPDCAVPEKMLKNTLTVPMVRGILATGTFASAAALISGLGLTTGKLFYASVDGYDTTDTALAEAKDSAVECGDVFIVASSSTVSFYGNSGKLQISQWNLDFGGVVNAVYDQADESGISHYCTTDRDSKLTINPYMLTKEEDDIDFLVKNSINGEVKIVSTHMTLDIPRGQCMSPAIANREGLQNTNRTYRCLRNDIGCGKKVSALPAWAMYEILIGARE